MQDLKVFMQPWSTLHAWHDHLCSMRSFPNHLIASSSSPSPSHFIAASSFTNFPLCPGQTMERTIASMCGAWSCLSIKYLITPNGLPSSELCPIYSGAAICPSWFQTAHCSMFSPYLLVRVFKFIDLGCVGTSTWWSFWFSTFSSLNMSDQVLKIDENSDVRFWGWVTVMHGFAIP
jgi:hypothetical protein